MRNDPRQKKMPPRICQFGELSCGALYLDPLAHDQRPEQAELYGASPPGRSRRPCYVRATWMLLGSGRLTARTDLLYIERYLSDRRSPTCAVN
jgi:hypothetical protein